jgi:hypothetical protein
MGFDLQRRTETFVNVDNHEHLASDLGLDKMDSITLDAAAFLTAFPSGDVPAGVEVSKAASGRYAPGIDDVGGVGVDGTAPGFLGFAVHVTAGVNPVGSLQWIGEVIAAKVPLGVGGSAPVAANHPHIRLV